MLTFCYLKIICFLHPRCHPKVIGDILKIQVRLFKWDYIINDNENETENEK